MITSRQSKILEILTRQQRTEVNLLAELLEVSQVTVRKDLDYLEDRGLIRREHGYACINRYNDTSARMAFNHDIKRRIAIAAAETVEEGETVMMESGSCCAMLAEELANSQKDVTIVTNSVFIANYIRNAPYTKIILLGGYYQPESQVVVGPITRKSGEIFFSDKFFVGTDGFMKDFGFTGRDLLRAQTVMDLSEYAREVIVLTDAEKFKRQGVLGLIRLDQVKSVYTDERIPRDIERFLVKKNINVQKVAENED